jgi:Flavin containing amine oxidoreductase
VKRRSVLGAPFALLGCGKPDGPGFVGGWVGTAVERGHDRREFGVPGVQRRVGAIVVGAGIAGLAAARAASRAGLDDVHVFELEDHAGGNSRGHVMGGMACPLGAHYLPVPGEQATEVAQWLDEIGVRRIVQGEAAYDERQLCHAPQERLFIAGQWVEGLLPPLDALPAEQRARTQAEYLRFQAAVESAGRDRAFCVPTARARVSAATQALDRVTFQAWLDQQGFTAPALRWYLDYCCRDDFGAGSAFVSAWAGLHYFASRHGFHAPGAETSERGAVLTWPQGNAWLAERLGAGLGERLHVGAVVLRVREGRFDASIDLWNVATNQFETWTAGHVVLAVPLFVAKRFCEAAPAALDAAAAALHHAPWLVANVQLTEPLIDRGGAAPAWDNVLMDGPTLGYVDAMHQSTRPFAGPTVLTAYWALGGDSPVALRAQRARLLKESWRVWADAVVAELARAHPDIRARVARIDLMRYGHAMAIPSPGVRTHPALAALAAARGRVRFAHSDLSGYSVFEEAFFHGDRIGRAIAAPKPRRVSGRVSGPPRVASRHSASPAPAPSCATA